MTIGVFGTGRFGRFWATALSEHSTVFTYNRSERPVPAGCTPATLDRVGACDAVMLCVAISSMTEALQSLVPHLQPGTVVMDTCSVKVFPAREMERLVPEGCPVIGTHPMFGPDSGAAGISGLPMVLSPVRADERTVRRWTTFFESVGLRVLCKSPDEHDREAAVTQGVTHFVGRLLADMGLEPSPIGTVGYRKLLEVMEQTCNDPYQLFVDLQRLNPHTASMRARLQRSLDRLLRSLPAQLDSESLDP